MLHLVGPHGPIAVLICLLGPFEIRKLGEPVVLRSGGKGEQLFSCLAMHPHVGVHRETLVEHIWPDAPFALASQCLNTLMHSLKVATGRCARRTTPDRARGKPLRAEPARRSRSRRARIRVGR